jgi:hypothetical protein
MHGWTTYGTRTYKVSLTTTHPTLPTAPMCAHAPHAHRHYRSPVPPVPPRASVGPPKEGYASHPLSTDPSTAFPDCPWPGKMTSERPDGRGIDYPTASPPSVRRPASGIGRGVEHLMDVRTRPPTSNHGNVRTHFSGTACAPPQPSPPDSSAVAVRPELVFGLRPISVGTPFSFITI